NLFGHTLEVKVKFKGKDVETFSFGSNRKHSKYFFEALRYLSAQTKVHFDLPEGELYDFVKALRQRHKLGGQFLLERDVNVGEKKPLK
ncbi:MAG: hypothetical protein AAF740_08190, partial [Bacteroidota bacterium]